MKNLVILALCLFGVSAGAQPPNPEEAQETLRFIRLAESKKSLSLDENKLLQLNEILDDFEAERFALKRQEIKLRRQIKRSADNETKADRLISDMIALKRRTLENEINLWTRVQKGFSAGETIEIFTFYEKFQRDVQRKVRMLQNRRQGREGGPRGKFGDRQRRPRQH